MRVLVMSDIHANYTALEAVLNDAGQVDETWGLGDLVGFGPDPNAVVEEVRDIPNLTCILGNHDVAVIGKMPLEAFNGDARRSLVYHEKVLSASNMDYMRSLSSNIKTLGEAGTKALSKITSLLLAAIAVMMIRKAIVQLLGQYT